MTPAEKDAIRAEASMRILAAMYARNWHTLTDVASIPDPCADEAQKDKERAGNMRRMAWSLEAASAADALIAELIVREEDHSNDPGTIAGLVAAGVAGGGQILSCKHGRTSFEPCPACDAEDAAERAEKEGNAPKPE